MFCDSEAAHRAHFVIELQRSCRGKHKSTNYGRDMTSNTNFAHTRIIINTRPQEQTSILHVRSVNLNTARRKIAKFLLLLF